MCGRKSSASAPRVVYFGTILDHRLGGSAGGSALAIARGALTIDAIVDATGAP
jgi:hypothetical protein